MVSFMDLAGKNGSLGARGFVCLFNQPVVEIYPFNLPYIACWGFPLPFGVSKSFSSTKGERRRGRGSGIGKWEKTN